MPKVSQEHLDARRKQVLDAAVECFARDGFHATTIEDIGREAGLSHGAIYRYFGSKEDIVEAIAEERQSGREVINKMVLDHDSTRAALRALVDGHFSFVTSRDERRRLPLTIQLWGEAIRNPRIRRIMRRAGLVHHGLLRRLLVEGQERGEVRRDLKTEAAAAFLVACFQGYVLQQASGFGVNVRDYLDAVYGAIDSFLTSQPRRSA